MKIVLIFFCLSSFNLFSQSWKDYIAENAHPIGKYLKLDSSHYASFKKYKLIMMGEMHGTLEPAKFIEQLARLILLYEDSVSIGLEIPNSEVYQFTQNPSEKTLLSSEFFTKKNEDGRNSTAWFALIKYCLQEPRIHLFFFDSNLGSCFGDRDDWMYKRIRDESKNHSSEKIITLSGNLHNQLVPIKIPDHDSAYYETMGSYCLQDSLTFPAGSVCSICHYYLKGKMLNNWGDGIELKKVKNEKSDLSKYQAKNYLLFYPESTEVTTFNCIFFTRKVHNSKSLDLKK